MSSPIETPPPPSPKMVPPSGSKRSRTPSVRSTKVVRSTAKKPRAQKSIFDNPERLMSDHKSPIYKDNVNLKALLVHPLAKATFAEAGKKYDFGALDCNDFATAVANFKDDGICGRYHPRWIREAMEASTCRAAGAFDDYIRSDFEETWEVPWDNAGILSSSKDESKGEDPTAREVAADAVAPPIRGIIAKEEESTEEEAVLPHELESKSGGQSSSGSNHELDLASHRTE